MKIYNSYSKDQLEDFLFDIKGAQSAWVAIEAHISMAGATNVACAASTLARAFHNHDGQLLLCSEDLFICMINVNGTDLSEIESKVTELLPEGHAEVKIATMSDAVIATIKNHVRRIEISQTDGPFSALFRLRQKRAKNVVLIADDDPLVRTLISTALQSHADVFVCETGENALDLYLQHLPDIVFLDIHMPAQSGPAILQKIREYDPTAFCYMLSADAVKDNVVGTHKRGASGFIAKPFSRQKIENAFAGSPTIQQTALAI